MTRIKFRKKPGVLKGTKRKPESVAKGAATRKTKKEVLGGTPLARAEEADVPHELNDTWGSPGHRIMPKYDTSNKP